MENNSTPSNKAEYQPVLKFERYKFNMSLLKWLIGSVALVTVTLIINNGFRERSAGIQEMQAFDKYVEVILKADNIEERWKLSEFFSTVTPTERLRTRWIAYKKLIQQDYYTFVNLKNEEKLLKEKIRTEGTPDAIKKLNRVQEQLEPFEKKLSNNLNNINKQPISAPISSLDNDNTDAQLNAFKARVKNAASTDVRFKLDEYFKKINEINNSVVRGLVKELGDPFQDIQTNINYDFNSATFSNQYGIISKFDNTKKIWPLLQAKFVGDKAIFSLQENGKTETFTSPIGDIAWTDVQKFIRTYFINRLNNLN